MTITITADIGYADAILPLSAELAADVHLVQVEAEQIALFGRSAGTSPIVTRGVNGTTAVAHSSGAVVTPLFVTEQSAAPLATPITSPLALADDLSVAKTVTSATPATERLVRSELTLTPATTLAVGSNGSLAGVRGALTLTSGKSITAGFLYGAQGKVVADGGTIAVGSGYVAGVLGQLSLTGATLTSGHIAALIANIGPTVPATAMADLIYAEAEQGPINSILKAYANTTYIFDLTAETNAGSYATTGSAGTTAAKGWLKVLIGGVVRYIPLADSVS